MRKSVYLKRAFRLRKPADFKRVRRHGTSFAHPFVVLIALANRLEQTRVGVAAGKSIGGAVQRNRAKRVLREAMRPLLNEVIGGQDILLLSRAKILGAKSTEIQLALKELIQRAGLQK